MGRESEKEHRALRIRFTTLKPNAFQQIILKQPLDANVKFDRLNNNEHFLHRINGRKRFILYLTIF